MNRQALSSKIKPLLDSHPTYHQMLDWIESAEDYEKAISLTLSLKDIAESLAASFRDGLARIGNEFPDALPLTEEIFEKTKKEYPSFLFEKDGKEKGKTRP